MQRWLACRTAVVFVLLIVIGCGFLDVSAQGRKQRRLSRRATSPVTPRAATQQPATSSADLSDEARIISTAEDAATTEASGAANRESSSAATTNDGVRAGSGNARRAAVSPSPEPDATQRTVERLSAEITKLNEKISQMESDQRTLVDLERLSRAEQRAENLRAQLRDTQAKESDLQARLEDLTVALDPTNIERSMAITGSTRPEEARELRRRQLESERQRVQTQLDQIVTSRTRLEASITNADADAERLRARVDAASSNTPAEPPATRSGAATEATSNVTGPTTDAASQTRSAEPASPQIPRD